MGNCNYNNQVKNGEMKSPKCQKNMGCQRGLDKKQKLHNNIQDLIT